MTDAEKIDQINSLLFEFTGCSFQRDISYYHPMLADNPKFNTANLDSCIATIKENLLGLEEKRAAVLEAVKNIYMEEPKCKY